MKRTPNGEIIRATMLDAPEGDDLKVVRSGNTSQFVRITKPEGSTRFYEEVVAKIEPPRRGWYAWKDDGRWYWIEGCDVCNGARRGYGYVRCVDHDICQLCAVPRDKASTSPSIGGGIGAVFGYDGGWICNNCNEEENRKRLIRANEAIERRTEEGETECFMEDNPTCPWCGESYSPDCDDSCYGASGEIRECDNCERKYKLTAEHSISYSSERVK